MKLPLFNHVRLLRYAGLITYVSVGIPILLVGNNPVVVGNRFGWFFAYALFGVAYWLATGNMGARRSWLSRLPMLLLLYVMAIAIGYFGTPALASMLLMVIAVILPWLLPVELGAALLVLMNFSMAPLYVHLIDPEYRFSWFEAFLQCAIYIGFSCMSFVSSLVARQQADSREEQRRLNSELRATRTLLTESSRMSERMRISRELHDLVGHHLTALSLNLEVASHLVGGVAQEHVRQAQTVAKLLLSDVREVVSQLREGDAIDLSAALKTLVDGVPGLAIHLDLPPRFAVDDPLRAQVLLRCAQEIITNTVKHASAANLWLRCERTPSNELAIHARDDGRGASIAFRHGNGLTGMRERLAQVGGRLDIDTRLDRGFALDAWLPLESGR
ncbi:MAG: sensor histidine kinase [Proteobacteria bacterium]|nr:sensor histidine kinase [Pseudomonadota bacterium]